MFAEVWTLLKIDSLARVAKLAKGQKSCCHASGMWSRSAAALFASLSELSTQCVYSVYFMERMLLMEGELFRYVRLSIIDIIDYDVRQASGVSS